MKLLDAANVNPRGGSRAPSDGRWLQGYNNSTRACAAQMEIEDPCGGESGQAPVPIVGNVLDRKASYFVQPFPIRSFLRQAVSCEQPDDKDWFAEAVKAKLEYVAGRALVTQFHPNVDTWIGDPTAQTVTLAGTTAAQYRTAVADAYDLWNSSVIDVLAEPIMHVPPRIAPDLVSAGILMATGPDEQSSIYGGKVVVSPGYDLNAKIFFTGEIVVRISVVDDEGGPLYAARINDVTLSSNQLMAIDVAPCSIVRVG